MTVMEMTKHKLVKIFEQKVEVDMTNIPRDYFTPVPRTYVSEDSDYGIEDDGLESMIVNAYGSGYPFFAPAETTARKRAGELLLMVKGLTKTYKQGENKLNILNNVDMRIYSGEIAALVGPSGSGKSTLLHILGLLDTATSGQIVMGDKDISKLSDGARTKLRNGHIGFVYQFHHLLPEFNAIENVALPLIIGGKDKTEAEERAADLLEQLGLGHRLSHRPATLSGGEQQRVAIARALVNDPYLLFADEPTGNLDPETSEEVFQILLAQVRGRGIGALIATHNMELANEMDRILEMRGGRIVPY